MRTLYNVVLQSNVDLQYESILDVDDNILDKNSEELREQEFRNKLKGYITPGGTQRHDAQYDIDFKTMTITLHEAVELYAGYGQRPSLSKIGIKKVDCKDHFVLYACPEDVKLFYNASVLNVVDRDANKKIKINIDKKQNIQGLKIEAPFAMRYEAIEGDVHIVAFDPTINFSGELSKADALKNFKSNCEHIRISGTGSYYTGQLDQAIRPYRELDERGRTKGTYDDIPNEVITKIFPHMPNLIQIDVDRYKTLYKKLKGGWKSKKD